MVACYVVKVTGWAQCRYSCYCQIKLLAVRFDYIKSVRSCVFVSVRVYLFFITLRYDCVYVSVHCSQPDLSSATDTQFCCQCCRLVDVMSLWCGVSRGWSQFFVASFNSSSPSSFSSHCSCLLIPETRHLKDGHPCGTVVIPLHALWLHDDVDESWRPAAAWLTIATRNQIVPIQVN